FILFPPPHLPLTSTLSLHDALPISIADEETSRQLKQARADLQAAIDRAALPLPSLELLKAAEDNLQRLEKVVGSGNVPAVEYQKDRKSTRLNSSHEWISYAVFCLKK